MFRLLTCRKKVSSAVPSAPPIPASQASSRDVEDGNPPINDAPSAQPPPYTASAQQTSSPSSSSSSQQPPAPPPVQATCWKPFPKSGILQDDDDACAVDIFCAPCTRRRSCKEFNEQFDSILSPMYCSRCGCDHPRIFFNSAQRLSKRENRVCINHDSDFVICKHHNFDLRSEQNVTACAEPECKHLKLQVSVLNPRYNLPGPFTISKKWEYVFSRVLELVHGQCQRRGQRQEQVQRPWIRLGLRCLRLNISQRPDLYCTHMATHTERFVSREFVGTYIIPEGDREFYIRCPCCTAMVTLSQPEKSTDLVIRFDQTAYVDPRNLAEGKWANLISLGSTGLAQDPELKYITWCLDSTCETSSHGKRLSLLLKHAHNWMNMRSSYLFDGKSQLDHVAK